MSDKEVIENLELLMNLELLSEAEDEELLLELSDLEEEDEVPAGSNVDAKGGE